MKRKQAIENKKRRLDEIHRHEEALKLKKKQKAFFRNVVKKFSSILFKDGAIEISIFKTATQLKKESELLDHCAFEQNYHLKLNSLMLSAKYNGTPIETIQVCLENYELLQSRGYDNENSKHHSRIVKLMESNLNQIKMINLGITPKQRKRKIKTQKAA